MENIPQEKEQKLELAVSINGPIEQILYKEPVIVSRETNILNVIKEFNEKNVSCVCVVENEKLVGVFTERDVVRKITGKNLDLSKEKVGNYMTVNPETLKITEPISHALNKMAAGGYRHIPLMNEENKLVGYLSIRDIIEHLADYYSYEIFNDTKN